jgi:hypothetical protein
MAHSSYRVIVSAATLVWTMCAATAVHAQVGLGTWVR